MYLDDSVPYSNRGLEMSDATMTNRLPQVLDPHEFVYKLLKKYRELIFDIDEVEAGVKGNRSESHLRERFCEVVLGPVFNYTSSKDYDIETKGDRVDLALLDENGLKAVVIEFKRRDKNVQSPKMKSYSFKYALPTTRYVAITNLDRLVVWTSSGKSLVTVDLEKIVKAHSQEIERNEDPHVYLDPKDVEKVTKLTILYKDEIRDPQRYSHFPSTPRRIKTGNIELDERNYNELLKAMDTSTSILQTYASSSFNRKYEEYKGYVKMRKALETDLESPRKRKDVELIRSIKVSIDALEEEKKVAIDFYKSYSRWREWAHRGIEEDILQAAKNEKDSEKRSVLEKRAQQVYASNSTLFCLESVYALIGKILFVRICEDKNLVLRKLSKTSEDVGIERWRRFTSYLGMEYKDLLYIAGQDVSKIYAKIFERGVFDWYTKINHDLNERLMKTFYLLSFFDFAGLDREALGRVYQEYLPPERRAALGEFYTRDEVVDYILDQALYLPRASEVHERVFGRYKVQEEWKPLEGIRVLDPACGSGTFLVHVVSRLLERLFDKEGLLDDYRKGKLDFSELADPITTLKTVINNVHGWDINPFAVYIAQLNMLFQLIDLYAEAKKRNPNFTMPSFNIHRTDSLVIYDFEKMADSVGNTVKSISISHQRRIDLDPDLMKYYVGGLDKAAASKKGLFDLIVGNPPYFVLKGKHKQKVVSSDMVELYRKEYLLAKGGELNTFRLFILRGLSKLRRGGTLALITASPWVSDSHSSRLRKFVLKNMSIKHITFAPESAELFYKVTQATTIFIMKNLPPTSATEIQMVDGVTGPSSLVMKERNKLKAETILQKAIVEKMENFDNGIPYPSRWMIIEKIVDMCSLETVTPGGSKVRSLHNLGSYVSDGNIKEGEIHLTKYKHFIRDEKDENRIPLLRGDIVAPYNVHFPKNKMPGHWLEKGESFDSKIETMTSKRIVWLDVVNMAQKRRIKAALVEGSSEKPIACGNTLNYLKIDFNEKKYSRDSILAMLNSNVLNFVFKTFSNTNHAKTREIRRLPIPLSPDSQIINVLDRCCRKMIRLVKKHCAYKETLRSFAEFIKKALDKTISDNITSSPFISEFEILQKGKGKIHCFRYDKKSKKLFFNLYDNIVVYNDILPEYIRIFCVANSIEDLPSLQDRLRIPQDLKTIESIVNSWKETKKIRDIEKQIKRLDEEINFMIYKLYGFDNKDKEDMKFIKRMEKDCAVDVVKG